MALTFGVLCTIFLKCTGEKVFQKNVIPAFVLAIDPDDQYWQGDRKSQISKLVSCERDFSIPAEHDTSSGAVASIRKSGSNVVIAARTKTTISIAHAVRERVLPLLDPDKARKFIFALKAAIRMDPVLTLARTKTFIKYFDCEPAEFLAKQHLNLSMVISAALLYCLAVGHNDEGKWFISYISDEANWSNLPETFLILDEVDGEFTVVDNVDSLQGYSGYTNRLCKANQEVRLCLPQHPIYDFDKLFVNSDICVMHSSNKVLVRHEDSIPNSDVGTFSKIGLHTLLTAIGGIGKTMKLKSLLFDCIRNYKKYNRIPFLVTLRSFSKEMPDLFTCIFEQVHPLWPELDSTAFHSILKSGRALLLLDGVDEISNENFNSFPDALRSFMHTYPNNQVVMSSRPIGNTFVSFQMFKPVKLMNFTIDQIIKLIDNVKDTLIFSNLVESFKKSVREELYPAYPHLVSNPLMLTILIPIYNEYGAVPLMTSTFFSTAFDVMISKHDFNKDGYKRALKTGLTSETFKQYLCELCASSYFDERFVFTQDQIHLLYECLECRNSEKTKTTAKAFVDDLCNSLCLMYQEGLNYHFIHRSFQEYFCALFVASQLEDDMEELIPFFDSSINRIMADSTFSMLESIAPARTKKAIKLPVLQEALTTSSLACVQKRGKKAGYWSYLLSQYPYISYVEGPQFGKEDEYFTYPKSAILFYLLSRDGIVHCDLDGDEVPHYDTFEEKIWYEVGYKRIGPFDCDDRSPIYHFRNEGIECEPCSYIMELDVRHIVENAHLYPDLIEYMESRSCPFMKEYLSAVKIYESLKKPSGSNIGKMLTGWKRKQQAV